MKKKLVIILCVIVVFLCYSFYVFRNSMYWDIMMAQKALNESRPENATKLPELSDAISEVRVTVVPRNCNIESEIFSIDGKTGSRQFLQIYYGYCVDGVWTDIPCENYPLVSVFNGVDMETQEPSISTGYEAADMNHMVKIGPYLLIRLEKELQAEDSLGNKTELLFTEYDSSYGECNGLYGYLKEDCIGKEQDFSAAGSFEACNYLIVECASIQENYELWGEEVMGKYICDRLMTYDEITYLLEIVE